MKVRDAIKILSDMPPDAILAFGASNAGRYTRIRRVTKRKAENVRVSDRADCPLFSYDPKEPRLFSVNSKIVDVVVLGE